MSLGLLLGRVRFKVVAEGGEEGGVRQGGEAGERRAAASVRLVAEGVPAAPPPPRASGDVRM